MSKVKLKHVRMKNSGGYYIETEADGSVSDISFHDAETGEYTLFQNDGMNIRRLVDCWSALAGIPDPKAFMRDVREHMGPLKLNTEEYNAILMFRIINALKGE